MMMIISAVVSLLVTVFCTVVLDGDPMKILASFIFLLMLFGFTVLLPLVAHG